MLLKPTKEKNPRLIVNSPKKAIHSPKKAILPKPKAAPLKAKSTPIKVKSAPIKGIKSATVTEKPVTKPVAKIVTSKPKVDSTQTLVLTKWLFEVKKFLESFPQDKLAQDLLKAFLQHTTRTAKTKAKS